MDMNTNSILRFLCQTYPFRRGRNRLRSFAMRHIGGVTLGADQFGNRLLLNLDSLMDCLLYLDGANEVPAMNELNRWAQSTPCDTFIDIGANIGCFTLFFAQQPNIQHIYSFEPDPGNHAQLVTNIWLNELHRKVQPYAIALSSESGTAEFHRPRNRQADEFGKYHMGTSGLDRYPKRHEGSEKVEVSKRRLDDVLEFHGKAIAIKIDVEGHELSVLRGMQELLRNNDCGLMMEVWGHDPENCRAVAELVTGLGYTRAAKDIEPDTHFYVKTVGAKVVASATASEGQVAARRGI
jgi:FkbM family methyltransferase